MRLSLGGTNQNVVLSQSTLLIIVCFIAFGVAGCGAGGDTHPTQEQIKFTFEQYILNINSELVATDASEIQTVVLGMGQGVYIRFKANEDFIQKMVKNGSVQYPFEPISCSEFFNAYSTEISSTIDWWQPETVTAPVCYKAEIRKYVLVDARNNTVYFYSFPDFQS